MPTTSHFADVSVATITLADEDSAAGLLKSLTALSQLGLRVAVTDGGSPESFLTVVRNLPGFDVQKVAQRGLVGQVMASIARAIEWKTPYVFYTEPDKEMFFSAHLASFLQRALSETPGGIAIAARSRAAFDTFPETQRTTESCLNTLCSGVTGVATDYTYGPFLAESALLPRVEGANLSLGWGWRTFLFVLAHRMGYRLSSIPGDFLCPASDRVNTESEQLHRMRQLVQNVNGVLAAMGQPL